MAQDMGIGRVGSLAANHKRKNRWLVEISPFVGHDAPMMPPHKGSRPDVTFSEMKADHLVETISYPGRPEWGTLDITVYDFVCNDNIFFKWLQRVYDPDGGTYKPSIEGASPYKIGRVTLKLFDGCGNEIERWCYDNCWPLKIQWGELDMSSTEVVFVDMSIKYDRAYLCIPGQPGGAPANIPLPSLKAS